MMCLGQFQLHQTILIISVQESMGITDFSAQLTAGEVIGEEIKNPSEWMGLFLSTLSFLFKKKNKTAIWSSLYLEPMTHCDL